jgi:predicted butyrate kinase (DUF1464 family)
MSSSLRVAGTDPGTSSLDVAVLEDGVLTDQARFPAEQVRDDPAGPVRWLEERGPFDLVAGPSGYGLPLVPAGECGEREWGLMTLVRPDVPRREQGVVGFSALLRELGHSTLPVVFLPGVIHLPTVPAYRKRNRIDLGTADKFAVAALALHLRSADRGVPPERYTGCVAELGSAFTACVVLHRGKVVDGVGGTAGPPGWQSPGAWDGEVAYLFCPLDKADLFTGGAGSIPDPDQARTFFREGLYRAVAGLRAVTPFDEVVLSGRLLETEPVLAGEVEINLGALGGVVRLGSLPGAWVKHAAQGAALLADGLAGGRHAGLVSALELRRAGGTVLDGLDHPRAEEVRGWFGLSPEG